MENNFVTNKFNQVKTFTYETVRKNRTYGELSQKEKDCILSEALCWEEKMFTKDGCKDCDRFDDFTPRFRECDTFDYKATVHQGVRGKFGGIQIIGTIKNKLKLRNFLENQPDKMPTFTPSTFGFWS
ncbi:hypothetical protein H6G91_17145 [Nostoc muscorum FACHB-395]|jgi:hypothetical protein|nr:hypothetical protein [Desmonostoc muscorum FACHB-395]